MIEVTLIGTGRLSFNLMNEILNNKIKIKSDLWKI